MTTPVTSVAEGNWLPVGTPVTGVVLLRVSWAGARSGGWGRDGLRGGARGGQRGLRQPARVLDRGGGEEERHDGLPSGVRWVATGGVPGRCWTGRRVRSAAGSGGRRCPGR